MAITKITRGRKSKRLLKYLLDEKPKCAHEGLESRVLASSAQNVELFNNDFERIDSQYEALRALSDKRDKNHQIYHIIQSFATDELNFRDEIEVHRANRLGLSLAKEIAGSQAQITVVTQADNASGLLHNHIVIGGVLLDGKSLQTNNVSVKNIRKTNDKVLADVRMMQHRNIASSVSSDGRKTMAEMAINQRGERTKKDIMREKLDYALAKSTSVDEFERILQDNDVSLIKGKRKKQTVFKYKVADDKAMTDRALGDSYSIDSVLERIAINAVALAEANEKERVRKRELEERSRKLEARINARVNALTESDEKECVRKRELEERPRKLEARVNEVASTQQKYVEKRKDVQKTELEILNEKLSRVSGLRPTRRKTKDSRTKFESQNDKELEL